MEEGKELKGWRLCASKMICIPEHYVIVMITFFGNMIVYGMRIIFSMAITEMTTDGTGIEKNPNRLFDWSGQDKQFIMCSFYIGYTIGHLPSGILIDMLGGKHVYGTGILVNAILTAITPLSCTLTKGNIYVQTVLRFVMGIFQAVVYPGASAFIGQWVPKKERAIIGSILFTGPMIGIAITNGLGGLLISATETWIWGFYIYGLLGGIWYIFFWLLCFSSPQLHPFIKEKELAYLEQELTTSKTLKKKIPWKSMLTSKALYAVIIAQVGHDFMYFIVVTDLNLFLQLVYNLNIKDNALTTSIPFLVMALVGISCGAIGDYIIKNKRMKVWPERILFTAISRILAPIFIVLLLYVERNKYLAFALVICALFTMGPYTAGFKVNIVDIAPNFAGMTMAVANGLGALTGFIGPAIVGALTSNNNDGWYIVVWMMLGVAYVTFFLWVILGTAKEQPWNNVDDEPQ